MVRIKSFGARSGTAGTCKRGRVDHPLRLSTCWSERGAGEQSDKAFVGSILAARLRCLCARSESVNSTPTPARVLLRARAKRQGEISNLDARRDALKQQLRAEKSLPVHALGAPQDGFMSRMLPAAIANFDCDNALAITAARECELELTSAYWVPSHYQFQPIGKQQLHKATPIVIHTAFGRVITKSLQQLTPVSLSKIVCANHPTKRHIAQEIHRCKTKIVDNSI